MEPAATKYGRTTNAVPNPQEGGFDMLADLKSCRPSRARSNSAIRYTLRPVDPMATPKARKYRWPTTESSAVSCGLVPRVATIEGARPRTTEAAAILLMTTCGEASRMQSLWPACRHTLPPPLSLSHVDVGVNMGVEGEGSAGRAHEASCWRNEMIDVYMPCRGIHEPQM